MRTLLSILVTIMVSHSFAASVSCDEIQDSIASGTFENIKFFTRQGDEKAVQNKLLREAVKISGHLTEQELSGATDKNLFRYFDPNFSVIRVGAKEFQSVNLSLGDNPFVYLFEMDTLKYSGVTSQDGTTYVDDAHCKIETDILN